jgi:hypothetical protein
MSAAEQIEARIVTMQNDRARLHLLDELTQHRADKYVAALHDLHMQLLTYTSTGERSDHYNGALLIDMAV